jgi:hypothetical protein
LPVSLRNSLLVVVLATLGLAVFGYAITADPVAGAFAEGGPIETITTLLWLVTAAGVVVVRRGSVISLAIAYLCLAAAARELDWHTAFTGYSVLKIGFYHRAEHALHHQLIAGLVMLGLIGSVTVLVVALVRRIRSTPRVMVPAWGWVLIVTAVTLVGSKVVDRAPAVLIEDADIRFSARTYGAMLAVEEGLEMLLPLGILAATGLAGASPRRAGDDA